MKQITFHILSYKNAVNIIGINNNEILIQNRMLACPMQAIDLRNNKKSKNKIMPFLAQENRLKSQKKYAHPTLPSVKNKAKQEIIGFIES